jgi:DNA gyrase subunit A
MGMQTREEDWVKDLFVSNTHDPILFFTNYGRVYRIETYEIPEAGRTAKGMAIVNLLNLTGGETVAAVVPERKTQKQPDEETNQVEYLTMITKSGIIKRTEITLFDKIKKSGMIALNIRENDALITVLKTDGKQDIFLATANGLGIRFPEDEARSMGRAASGVFAMKLRENDRIVGATAVEGHVLFVSANGFGKCTKVADFRKQHRGGKGLIIYKPSEKTGSVVGICAVNEKDELMLINSEGVIIRIRVSDISIQGRHAQGVKLIQMDEGTTVAGMAKIAETELNGDGEEQE